MLMSSLYFVSDSMSESVLVFHGEISQLTQTEAFKRLEGRGKLIGAANRRT
jgi:hypothetical protein